MFSWFKKREKENWRLVKSIAHSIRLSDESSKTGSAYFHLFESEKGNRKVDITVTLDGFRGDPERSAKKLPIYQTKIYRWVNGRYDPDIPRYNEIPEEDTVNALKGSVD